MGIGAGLGGFLAGAVITPVAMIAGAYGVAKGASLVMGEDLTPDKEPIAHAFGAVGAAVGVMSALAPSSFTTGFKVAVVAWTVFAGAFLSREMLHNKLQLLNIFGVMRREFSAFSLFVSIIASVAGSIIAGVAIATFPAVPAFGICLGALGAFVLTKVICEWAVKRELRGGF